MIRLALTSPRIVAAGFTAILFAACQGDAADPLAPGERDAPMQLGENSVQVCTEFDTSTEEVLPGVTLTYGSSFRCEDAPPSGSYQFTVNVANDAASSEAVVIDGLTLLQTTPRPRGSGPDATGSADGLPITVAPGESDDFSVSGTYELVETDEGSKANLHFQASGEGVESGLSFNLGINAHLRGAGAVEE